MFTKCAYAAVVVKCGLLLYNRQHNGALSLQWTTWSQSRWCSVWLLGSTRWTRTSL